VESDGLTQRGAVVAARRLGSRGKTAGGSRSRQMGDLGGPCGGHQRSATLATRGSLMSGSAGGTKDLLSRGGGEDITHELVLGGRRRRRRRRRRGRGEEISGSVIR